MKTKMGIHAIITMSGSITLLVDYKLLRVLSAQKSVFRHLHGIYDILIIEIYGKVCHNYN